MDILKQSDSYFLVLREGVECFSFCTFGTIEIMPSNYSEYDDFYNDINKYFVENNEITSAVDNQLNCICVEPMSYNENMTIEEWSQAFQLIYDELKTNYVRVYFKLMVIGNKFSYVCAKTNMTYITNVFIEYFDEESGMKNQEYLIYTM